MSLSLQGHGNVFTINFDSLLLGIFRLLLSPRAGSVRREENGRTKVKENSDDKLENVRRKIIFQIIMQNLNREHSLESEFLK